MDWSVQARGTTGGLNAGDIHARAGGFGTPDAKCGEKMKVNYRKSQINS
jgi:hypothetical protein